jgi:hypothetical protein
MSRWLKSVNNLLETLDGQAENVAEEGLIDDKFGALLESGKKVILQRQTSSDSEESYDEEEFMTDDDEDDDDDEYEDYEEEVHDEVEEDHTEEEVIMAESSHGGETLCSEDTDGGLKSEDATVDEEDAVSIGFPSNRHISDNISDMSFSESFDDVAITEEGQGQAFKTEEKAKQTDETPADQKQAPVVLEKAPSSSDAIDSPPKTPARVHSAKLEDHLERQHSDRETGIRMTIPEENTTNNSSQNRPIQNSGHSSVSKNEVDKATRSSYADQSPIPPRRSLDVSRHLLLEAAGNILQDDDDDDEGGSKSADSPPNSPSSDIAPPRQPTRQTSRQVFTQEADKEKNAAQKTSASGPPPPSLAPPFAPPKTPPRPVIKPKETKEYQKLLAKVQSLQIQLNQTSSELKSTQSVLKSSQSLQNKSEKQVKTLNIKLETANAEINAQNEELRRAGERMEKDRARAEEEREDLFDEHEEEVEQLKESHDKEVDQLKTQYESQIRDLKQQRDSEESKRMQEGGDWTKELEDAVSRERDAIKKVNEVQSEQSQLQSDVSKLQTEQKTLQTKLDAALQANKTATGREREAEDKLDAALSAHSRQISQRQAREAELEKTVFDLGAALTVAQQKQIQRHIESVPTRMSNGEAEKYKEQLINAMDELDILQGQLDTETQRRQALQEELNEISRERTEEASSTQARQRQHDRKVSELVTNIARLQKSLKEQQGEDIMDAENSATTTPQLKQQLEASKTEITRLSDSLMRHHGQVETSKAEIMTLRGRLQMATKRADDAEKSLMASQSAPRSTERGYDVEAAGVGIPAVRRRKGGRSRGRSASQSIRSALNLPSSGGRTNPVTDQVVQTIDALDSWMVETGSFMRHEPLARIGFMCYLMTLHLWTFALIIFHTTEEPHGDFGSMDSNPRHWRDHGS